MAQAIGQAMETGRAFSWMKTRKVQTGVYLECSQGFFTKYRANK